MPGLLEGKTALILGVANRWSLAYAIAEAFRREGALTPAGWTRWSTALPMPIEKT